mgnify:CR=1 FL=1
MRNYKMKIERTNKKFIKAELKSKTVKIVLTPKKGHIHVLIKVSGGKFKKSAHTSICSDLRNDEIKILANHIYNEFSKHSCVIGIESYNYSQIFGSCWM